MHQKGSLLQLQCAKDFIKMQTVPWVWGGPQYEWHETRGLNSSYCEAFITAFPAKAEMCDPMVTQDKGQGIHMQQDRQHKSTQLC